jgi:hypothetical protein
MMTLSHTGGSLLLEDATASAVVRYSLALAKHHEMAAVTLDDAATPAPRSQVVLIVGMGVPLSIRSARRTVELFEHGESGDDLDERTDARNAPRNVVGATSEEYRQDAERAGMSHMEFDLL